jgi:hypothetical protein
MRVGKMCVLKPLNLHWVFSVFKQHLRIVATTMAPLRRGFLMPRGSSHAGRASSCQEVVKLERESLYKAATAALGTAAIYLWGGWDAVFTALVVLACRGFFIGRLRVAFLQGVDVWNNTIT